jgi:hypothetical protein
MQDDFIHLAKHVALGAMLLTMICTMAVLGLQLASVFAGKAWTFLSVRELLEIAASPDRQDVTSAIGLHASARTSIFQWVLELPAVLLLASALGLILLYYNYLNSLDA